MNVGNDITVFISGSVRIAGYDCQAVLYKLDKPLTVKLRVIENILDRAFKANLPAFLYNKVKEHWGNIEICGYSAENGCEYFLEKGTYQILKVETLEDRIKSILSKQEIKYVKTFGQKTFEADNRSGREILFSHYPRRLGR